MPVMVRRSEALPPAVAAAAPAAPVAAPEKTSVLKTEISFASTDTADVDVVVNSKRSKLVNCVASTPSAVASKEVALVANVSAVPAPPLSLSAAVNSEIAPMLTRSLPAPPVNVTAEDASVVTRTAPVEADASIATVAAKSVADKVNVPAELMFTLVASVAASVFRVEAPVVLTDLSPVVAVMLSVSMPAIVTTFAAAPSSRKLELSAEPVTLRYVAVTSIELLSAPESPPTMARVTPVFMPAPEKVKTASAVEPELEERKD